MYLTPHLFTAAGANLAAPDPMTFPQAFSFCSAIVDARLRGICWGSFGKEFIPLAGARDIRAVDTYSDAAYRQAQAWCALAPQTEAAYQCIGQALASVFWGGENDPQASFRFCSLVTDPDTQDFCYDKLGLNIALYTTGSEKEKLCAELPESHRDSCTAADGDTEV
jgi:hypothetical protein